MVCFALVSISLEECTRAYYNLAKLASDLPTIDVFNIGCLSKQAFPATDCDAISSVLDKY